MDPLFQLMEYLLPADTLKWFDVTHSSVEENILVITLTEKNNPPLTEQLPGKHFESNGFKEITVTDFPIRGRKVTLIFRRRYWQVEGQKELLKRDIPLCAPGTQLALEFASFLKDASTAKCRFFGIDRQVESPESQPL